ncbi:SPOR domain-containing protein [Sagittula sp. S175]|uniref:SPOR domain-containing protein n=1 Tax=Sagittula sp. S175 TaxID=3415129 RepID=UPI003C7B0C64
MKRAGMAAKWRATVVAAMTAGAVVVSQAAAAEEEVLPVLLADLAGGGSDASSRLIAHLDALSGNTRTDAVRQVLAEWDRMEADRGDTLPLATVLCKVAPIDLPAEDARAAQAALFGAFDRVMRGSVEDMDQRDAGLARYLDCAAHNIAPGYFSVSGALDGLMPFQQCDSARALREPELARLAEDLGAITAADGAGRSYYTLRSAYFAATVEVARAMAGAAEWETQRARIGAAGAALLERTADAGTVQARNGWRNLNDLTYFGALYALVDTAPDSPERAETVAQLQALTALPPAVEDARLAGAMEPWVRAEIAASAPGYVDPVHVLRLFPGAQRDAEADCRLNRKQSIETADLARGTLACLASDDPYGSREAFQAFDRCLGRIESPVWWVQVGAYRTMDTAEEAKGYFETTYGLQLGADKGAIDFDIAAPDAESTLYRVRTGSPLSRSDAGVLADQMKLDKRSVLLGREKVY